MKKIIIFGVLILLSGLSVGYININSCGTLNSANTEYRLTADIIDHSGSCFVRGANNITLNCMGHTIDGQKNGDMIYNMVATYSPWYIQNCIISDWINFDDYTFAINQLHIENTNISNCGKSNIGAGESCFWAVNQHVYINDSEIWDSPYLTGTFGNNLYLNITHSKVYNSTLTTALANMVYFEVYDNYLYNVTISLGNFNHKWNTTEHIETNIMGGSVMCGNFWDGSINFEFSESCSDIDLDGFCDDYYTVSAGTDYDYCPISRYGVEYTGNIDVTFRDFDTGDLLIDDLTYVCLYDYDDLSNDCGFTFNGKTVYNWSFDNHSYRLTTERTGYIDKVVYFDFDSVYEATLFLKNTVSGTFVGGTVYDKKTGAGINNCDIWIDDYWLQGSGYHNVGETCLDGSYLLFVPTCEPFVISPHCTDYYYDGEWWFYTEDTDYVYGDLWECTEFTANKTTYINFPMTESKDFCNLTINLGFYDSDLNCIINDTKSVGAVIILEGQTWGDFGNITMTDHDYTIEVMCDTYEIDVYRDNTSEHKEMVSVLNDYNYTACLHEYEYYFIDLVVQNRLGQNLSNALVTITSTDESYYYKTIKTNSTGHAYFPNLLSQYYDLTITAEGYKQYKERIYLINDLEYCIIMDINSYIYGVVYDLDDTPLSNVLLTLKHNKTGITYTGKSFILGTYKIELPIGNYTLLASLDGYHQYIDFIEVEGIKNYNLKMTSINDFINVIIYTQYSDYSPMGNVEIQISGDNIAYSKLVYTDSKGEYSGKFPEGIYNLKLRKGDYWYNDNDVSFYSPFGETLILTYQLKNETLPPEKIIKKAGDLNIGIGDFIVRYGMYGFYIFIAVILLFFLAIGAEMGNDLKNRLGM